MKAGSKKVHSSKCLLGTLASSIFGNLLAGKPKTLGRGVIRAGEGVDWAGEGTVRAG